MVDTHGQYQSYLLRLYRPAPHITWRVILESIPGGEQQGSEQAGHQAGNLGRCTATDKRDVPGAPKKTC